MVLNHLASWIKLIRSPVKSSTSELIAPFVATNCKIIPATTTIEKKCGKYEAVCTSLLNFFDFSSFNKSAKIIGAGKQINNVRPLRMSVFVNTFKNVG